MAKNKYTNSMRAGSCDAHELFIFPTCAEQPEVPTGEIDSEPIGPEISDISAPSTNLSVVDIDISGNLIEGAFNNTLKYQPPYKLEVKSKRTIGEPIVNESNGGTLYTQSSTPMVRVYSDINSGTEQQGVLNCWPVRFQEKPESGITDPPENQKIPGILEYRSDSEFFPSIPTATATYFVQKEEHSSVASVVDSRTDKLLIFIPFVSNNSLYIYAVSFDQSTTRWGAEDNAYSTDHPYNDLSANSAHNKKLWRFEGISQKVLSTDSARLFNSEYGSISFADTTSNLVSLSAVDFNGNIYVIGATKTWTGDTSGRIFILRWNPSAVLRKPSSDTTSKIALIEDDNVNYTNAFIAVGDVKVLSGTNKKYIVGIDAVANDYSCVVTLDTKNTLANTTKREVVSSYSLDMLLWGYGKTDSGNSSYENIFSIYRLGEQVPKNDDRMSLFATNSTTNEIAMYSIKTGSLYKSTNGSTITQMDKLEETMRDTIVSITYCGSRLLLFDKHGNVLELDASNKIILKNINKSKIAEIQESIPSERYGSIGDLVAWDYDTNLKEAPYYVAFDDQGTSGIIITTGNQYKAALIQEGDPASLEFGCTWEPLNPEGSPDLGNLRLNIPTDVEQPKSDIEYLGTWTPPSQSDEFSFYAICDSRLTKLRICAIRTTGSGNRNDAFLSNGSDDLTANIPNLKRLAVNRDFAVDRASDPTLDFQLFGLTDNDKLYRIESQNLKITNNTIGWGGGGTLSSGLITFNQPLTGYTDLFATKNLYLYSRNRQKVTEIASDDSSNSGIAEKITQRPHGTDITIDVENHVMTSGSDTSTLVFFATFGTDEDVLIGSDAITFLGYSYADESTDNTVISRHSPDMVVLPDSSILIAININNQKFEIWKTPNGGESYNYITEYTLADSQTTHNSTNSGDIRPSLCLDIDDTVYLFYESKNAGALVASSFGLGGDSRLRMIYSLDNGTTLQTKNPPIPFQHEFYGSPVYWNESVNSTGIVNPFISLARTLNVLEYGGGNKVFLFQALDDTSSPYGTDVGIYALICHNMLRAPVQNSVEGYIKAGIVSDIPTNNVRPRSIGVDNIRVMFSGNPEVGDYWDLNTLYRYDEKNVALTSPSIQYRSLASTSNTKKVIEWNNPSSTNSQAVFNLDSLGIFNINCADIDVLLFYKNDDGSSPTPSDTIVVKPLSSIIDSGIVTGNNWQRNNSCIQDSTKNWVNSQFKLGKRTFYVVKKAWNGGDAASVSYKILDNTKDTLLLDSSSVSITKDDTYFITSDRVFWDGTDAILFDSYDLNKMTYLPELTDTRYMFPYKIQIWFYQSTYDSPIGPEGYLKVGTVMFGVKTPAVLNNFSRSNPNKSRFDRGFSWAPVPYTEIETAKSGVQSKETFNRAGQNWRITYSNIDWYERDYMLNPLLDDPYKTFMVTFDNSIKHNIELVRLRSMPEVVNTVGDLYTVSFDLEEIM